MGPMSELTFPFSILYFHYQKNHLPGFYFLFVTQIRINLNRTVKNYRLEFTRTSLCRCRTKHG